MLSKTGIDYLERHWGFYTGCRHTVEVCPCADECWAKGMAKRFKAGNFEPTLHTEKLLDPLGFHRQVQTGKYAGSWGLRQELPEAH